MYPEPSTRNTWSPLPAAFAATGLAAAVAAAGLVSAGLGAAALVSALAGVFRDVFGELLGMAAMYEFLRQKTASTRANLSSRTGKIAQSPRVGHLTPASRF